MTDPVRTRSGAGTDLVWSVLRAEADRLAGGRPVSVLDVGGGSGVFAVPFAELGHQVTVVDSSADALATLARRAADAGVGAGVVGIQGDVDRLNQVVPTGGFDLVLCHSLLEVVDDPEAALGIVAGALRSGGRLSLLVANRAATVLARAVGGHFDDALRALSDPAGRWGAGDRVRQRFDGDRLRALLAGVGLSVERLHGVGVFTDLVPGSILDSVPGASEALRALENAASGVPPYRDLATALHAVAS